MLQWLGWQGMLATVRAKFPQVRTPSRGPRGFPPLPPHPLCPCALRRRGTFRPASSRAHWRTPTPPCCYSMRARRTRCVAAHEAMRALLRCCRDCGPASPPLAVRSCAPAESALAAADAAQAAPRLSGVLRFRFCDHAPDSWRAHAVRRVAHCRRALGWRRRRGRAASTAHLRFSRSTRSSPD